MQIYNKNRATAHLFANKVNIFNENNHRQNDFSLSKYYTKRLNREIEQMIDTSEETMRTLFDLDQS